MSWPFHIESYGQYMSAPLGSLNWPDAILEAMGIREADGTEGGSYRAPSRSGLGTGLLGSMSPAAYNFPAAQASAPTSLQTLGQAILQRGAAAAKAITYPADAVMDAYNGVQRVANRASGGVEAAWHDWNGDATGANSIRSQTQQNDQNIYNQRLLASRAIEHYVPPPTDSAGRFADTLTSLLVGSPSPRSLGLGRIGLR